MAPPIPGTIFPGTIQLASRPCASTCSPPMTVRSTCPPRMRPNDIALSNVEAPGQSGDRPPGRIGETLLLHPRFGESPRADEAVLRLEEDQSTLDIVGDQRRDADPEIDQHSRTQLARDTPCDDLLRHHDLTREP